MTADLAAYRTTVDALLATAVDASTWTDAIKDQALRQALAEYDDHFVYETSVTVTSGGAYQDLSSVDALKDIQAVAYPWSDEADFAARQQRWRYAADQTIYVETATPQAGQAMRVRYTKRHEIEDLDAATATSVPDGHQLLLATLAAAFACTLRCRQLSENPAIPEHALAALAGAATHYRTQAAYLLRTARIANNPAWSRIGL